jgi:predicted nucleotidyltransferase
MIDALDLDLSPVIAEQPDPVLFATVSGAHLYGFPSRDSDVDLRGVHLLSAADRARVRADVERLHGVLDEAQGASALPDALTAYDALHDLVVRIRLKG